MPERWYRYLVIVLIIYGYLFLRSILHHLYQFHYFQLEEPKRTVMLKNFNFWIEFIDFNFIRFGFHCTGCS